MLSHLLPIPLLVPVLVAMLVLTTPVGTGGHEHQDELLHPVLPHAHLIDGRIVSGEQLAAKEATRTRDGAITGRQLGPAVGAGDGADEAGFGLGLVPTVPLMDMALPDEAEQGLVTSADTPPVEFRDPPEEPPPNEAA